MSRSSLALQQFDNPELQNAPASWPYQYRALGVLLLGVDGSSDLRSPEFLLSLVLELFPCTESHNKHCE